MKTIDSFETQVEKQQLIVNINLMRNKIGLNSSDFNYLWKQTPETLREQQNSLIEHLKINLMTNLAQNNETNNTEAQHANTYSKYVPNVFLAKCTQQYNKGEVIPVTTKYGKENDCIVFNLIGQKDGFYYYSIVRADGFNVQEYARKKAEKLQGYAANAEDKSTAYWNASHEGRDFLALGEPIKVGHHSEKRHRALIERNHNRMHNAVEMDKKAKEYESRAEYWKAKESTINLSMPESIEFYEYKLELAKEKHEMYKNHPEKRQHSFSLTYAKKEVNEMTKNLELAKKLWS